MPGSPASEFQNYLFFLFHFRQLIGRGRSNAKAELLQHLAVAQTPLLAHMPPRALSAQDRAAIRKYVFTAWNSEAVARLPAGFDPEVLQFTNQWKPVQAYYSIYFHLVSLHLAINGTASRSHAPTLRYATSTILPYFPQPWCLRLDYNTRTLDQFPDGTSMTAPTGWNVSRDTDSHTYVACFFRSTAQRNQRELWRDQYKGKRRRLLSGPRAGKIYTAADVKVDSVSVLNVLWRFRRWANYLEGDTIIEGGDYTPHAVEFDQSFNDINETTALVCEHILRSYLGTAHLRELYQEYLQLVGARLDCEPVERRRMALCP